MWWRVGRNWKGENEGWIQSKHDVSVQKIPNKNHCLQKQAKENTVEIAKAAQLADSPSKGQLQSFPGSPTKQASHFCFSSKSIGHISKCIHPMKTRSVDALNTVRQTWHVMEWPRQLEGHLRPSCNALQDPGIRAWNVSNPHSNSEWGKNDIPLLLKED